MNSFLIPEAAAVEQKVNYSIDGYDVCTLTWNDCDLNFRNCLPVKGKSQKNSKKEMEKHKTLTSKPIRLGAVSLFQWSVKQIVKILENFNKEIKTTCFNVLTFIDTI